jgi:hypothetical protein
MTPQTRPLFNVALAVRQQPWAGYTVGLGSLVIRVLVRVLIDDVLPPGLPYLTFLPAVFLTTFFGGLGLGTACAIVPGVAGWYWFLAHGSVADLGSSAVALLLYGITVTIIIAFVHSLNVAVERAARWSDYRQLGPKRRPPQLYMDSGAFSGSASRGKTRTLHRDRAHVRQPRRSPEVAWRR